MMEHDSWRRSCQMPEGIFCKEKRVTECTHLLDVYVLFVGVETS